MSNYQYQETAAETLLKNILTNKYIGGVLGSVPGSGKTTISFHFINKYLVKFPNAKVLVLTHNTNVLKNQYLADLTNSHIKINFSFGDLNSDAQVRVGIPASIKDLSKVDLLIVDEAHHYWGQKMVTDIYKAVNPNHVLLLTGSPSSFIQHNYVAKIKGKKQYFIHTISGEELVKNNVFSEVAINSVAGLGVRSKIENALKKAVEKKYNTDKIMIACSTCEEAKIAANYIKTFDRKVSLSLSENDSDSVEFQRFLDGETDVLVVADRGILGFSCKELTLLIDLKCSQDIDNRFQLIARVLRKHPKNIRKAYISAPKDGKNELTVLQKTVKMMERETFNKYMGI